MRLKKLSLKNIRSYAGAELEFPGGSTLLSGDIGSGKTSILLAIEYALFGLQPGQRGSALLANGEDKGSVALECEVEGKEVVIERALKRGSKSITQDYARITIDGRRIESSVTEVKTKVLELLGYPKEFIKRNNVLYRYTVYTPQEQMKQIMLEDAESRLNILRSVFGIDKYRRIKENVSKLAAKLREESRFLQVELKDLEESKNKRDSSKKFLSLLSGRIETKQKELENEVVEIKKIEQELHTIEQGVKEKEIFSKEIEKTNILLATKRDQARTEDKAIQELEEKLAQSKELFDQELFEQIIASIKEAKETIEATNKEYITVSSQSTAVARKKQEDADKKERIFKIDICPTCLQDVSDTHKHNILNETETQIKQAEKEQATIEIKLSELTRLLDIEKKKLEEYERKRSDLEILRVKTEEVKAAQERITNLRELRARLANDIEFLEKHVQTLKASTLEFAKFDNLRALKEGELRQELQREKQAEIEIAELRKEVELANREIRELSEKIEQGEKRKQELIELLEIENWLSGEFSNLVAFMEKSIMMALRSEFSKLFNKWFSMLTTDAFHVHLDENFTPIITQGDFELEYSFLSGGERTAVALAYRLALNQILNSVLSTIKTRDLVILDEPTDGFSGQQLDKVRDILQELDIGQLIIVSHEQKIESFVDNVIRLKKEGGVSSTEEPKSLKTSTILE